MGNPFPHDAASCRIKVHARQGRYPLDTDGDLHARSASYSPGVAHRCRTAGGGHCSTAWPASRCMPLPHPAVAPATGPRGALQWAPLSLSGAPSPLLQPVRPSGTSGPQLRTGEDGASSQGTSVTSSFPSTRAGSCEHPKRTAASTRARLRIPLLAAGPRRGPVPSDRTHAVTRQS